MSLPSIIRLLREQPRIVIGATTANWNSGVAPSGLAGATIFTIGVAGSWCRLNFGAVVLTGFNVAATVTIREYCDVAGANRLVMEDDWTMPGELALLSWWIDQELYGPYRIELLSDQAADDGLNVAYEYRIKAW